MGLVVETVLQINGHSFEVVVSVSTANVLHERFFGSTYGYSCLERRKVTGLLLGIRLPCGAIVILVTMDPTATLRERF